jgi:hypothetical protein
MMPFKHPSPCWNQRCGYGENHILALLLVRSVVLITSRPLAFHYWLNHTSPLVAPSPAFGSEVGLIDREAWGFAGRSFPLWRVALLRSCTFDWGDVENEGTGGVIVDSKSSD